MGKKFEKGATDELKITDSDVGDINKIILKLYGRNDYRCKEIKINKGPNNYTFPCLKKLTPCTISTNKFICQEEILPEGDTAYEITIKTSDEENSGTDSPFIIGLFGEKGISIRQMYSQNGLDTGSQNTSVIKVDDLGDISGYYLELAETGKWRGKHLIVKTIKNGNLKQFDLKDIVLKNPGNSFYKFDSLEKDRKNSENDGDDGNNDNDLKVNEKGLIGKSKGGLNNLLNLLKEEKDDENDTIKNFAKYEGDDENPKDIIDFNASVTASVDSKGLNMNKVGGLINTLEEKGKLIKQF